MGDKYRAETVTNTWENPSVGQWCYGDGTIEITEYGMFRISIPNEFLTGIEYSTITDAKLMVTRQIDKG